MDLFDFIERFPGEDDCIEYFISIREKVGIACRNCDCNKTNWSVVYSSFECEQCKNHISIKSGTVMEESKLPVKYWFIAIHLLTSATEKFTQSEILEKFSGSDSEQVNQMLVGLNSCLANPTNGKSFDQLLMACIANHNHSPSTDRHNRNKLLTRNPSTMKSHYPKKN